MTRFIVRRLLLGVLTLLPVSVIVFAATQALPGNAARAILGKQATPERVSRRSAHSYTSTSRRSRSTSIGSAGSSTGTSALGGHASSRSAQLLRVGSATRRSWCSSRRW